MRERRCGRALARALPWTSSTAPAGARAPARGWAGPGEGAGSRLDGAGAEPSQLGVRAKEPQAAIEALAMAWRAWAHQQPARCQSLFGTPVAGCRDDPARTAAPAQRALQTVVEVIARLTDRPEDEAPAAVVDCWARLHGFVAVELGGHFQDPGLDVDAAYRRVLRGLL